MLQSLAIVRQPVGHLVHDVGRYGSAVIHDGWPVKHVKSDLVPEGVAGVDAFYFVRHQGFLSPLGWVWYSSLVRQNLWWQTEFLIQYEPDDASSCVATSRIVSRILLRQCAAAFLIVVNQPYSRLAISHVLIASRRDYA